MITFIYLCGGFLLFLAVQILRAHVLGNRRPRNPFVLPREMTPARVIELISRPAVVERRSSLTAGDLGIPLDDHFAQSCGLIQHFPHGSFCSACGAELLNDPALGWIHPPLFPQTKNRKNKDA